MSPSTIDRHELEDRLRSALRARAATTAARPPERFAPGSRAAVRAGGPSPRRRALVVGAAAVVAGVLAIAAVALTRDGNDDVSTRPPTPEEEGLAVHGPSGSRWFVLDLPGVTATSASVEDRGEGGITAPEQSFQAFRTPDGFAGPALWVESIPAGTERSSDDDPPGTRTTIQGRDATVSQVGGSVMIERPGGADEGFRITAIHMDVDDVVDFAEGLFPRESGGWNAVGLPQGLVEIPHDGEAPADVRYAEWSYTDRLDGNYELFVSPGGDLEFEDWVREHAADARSVEPLTVDRRPGVIVQTESELVAVWRPTDTAVADFRVNGTVDDLVADLEALRPVDEATWRAHLPPDVRSQIPG